MNALPRPILPRPILPLVLLVALVASPVAAQTSVDVFNDYAATPYDHPNIPNNSFAGYRGDTKA